MIASPISVVVADDHPTFRMGVVGVIAAEVDMTVIGEASSGAEAAALCVRLRPRILLTDLRMPGGDGFEAIARLRNDVPDTDVIVLTTFDLEEDIFRAFHFGAKAYLLKDSSRAEIANTVRRVRAGETVMPLAVEERLRKRLQREELSAREREVLALVVFGRSNKEIAATLHLSEDTVKSHLKTLFAKMAVRARTEAAIEAVRTGIVRL